MLRHIALNYAKNHAHMADPKTPGCEKPENNFAKQGGITNGAAWYSVGGGMQDFNYLSSNDFEITLELGCVKYPEASQLKQEWEDNKKALLEFMWMVRAKNSTLSIFLYCEKCINHTVHNDASLF